MIPMLHRFIILLPLLGYVQGYCSEAHRQACSFPLLQLDALSSASTPTSTYIPDYNETTLAHVCKLYEDYKNCSVPFLAGCNNLTTAELKTYDSILGIICHELRSDYIKNRLCYRRLASTYKSCQNKLMAAYNALNENQTGFKYHVCSTFKDYALCIYTVTALGCSMSAANVYFKLLNYTVSSILHINNVQCVFVHPLDEISIYTTSTSTSPYPRTSWTSFNSPGDSPKQIVEVSRSCNVHLCRSVQLFVFLLIFLSYVEDKT